MPPQAVVCELCGGKFFKSSLPIHQKACRVKVGVQCHPCPYCHAGVPMLEMDAHVRRCPEAKAAGAKPTGVSAALANRLDRDRRRQNGEIIDTAETRVGGGGGRGGGQEYADGDDARIACQICGRKFNMDRVGKHQAICEKLATKKPRKPMLVVRSYCEGGSEGRVLATVKTGPGREIPNPPPIHTDWKRRSEEFRAAMKAARQYPMPKWGEESSYSRGPSQSRGHASSSPSPARRGGGRDMGGTARSRPSPGPAASPARQRRSGSPEAAASSSLGPAEMKQMFKRLDVNNDGVLDFAELKELLKAGNSRISDRQLKVLFASVDANGDGKVDFNEFIDYIHDEPQLFETGMSSTATRTGGFPAGSGRSAVVACRGGASRSPAAGHGGGGRSSPSPLPEWGSGSSRYGRDCMTSPPVRTTPHNTASGGCARVAPPKDPGGMHSNYCSPGNPLARW